MDANQIRVQDLERRNVPEPLTDYSRAIKYASVPISYHGSAVHCPIHLRAFIFSVNYWSSYYFYPFFLPTLQRNLLPGWIT